MLRECKREERRMEEDPFGCFGGSRGARGEEGWVRRCGGGGCHTCTKMTAALTHSRAPIGLMDESRPLRGVAEGVARKRSAFGECGSAVNGILSGVGGEGGIEGACLGMPW